MFGSLLLESEKKERNKVKHVKIDTPLCAIEIRKKRSFSPNWLFSWIPKKWSSSLVAKYYVYLSGYFLEKKEENGAVTLEPTKDFEVVYIERKKENCLNGYKRFKKFSFLKDAGKQSTRDFINNFWNQVKNSIKEAYEDRNGCYLIEIRHVSLLNPDKEYQEMLKEKGVKPTHTEIYNSDPKRLGIYEGKKIVDEKSYGVSGHYVAFPIDVVDYMLATRKKISISYFKLS